VGFLFLPKENVYLSLASRRDPSSGLAESLRFLARSLEACFLAFLAFTMPRTYFDGSGFCFEPFFAMQTVSHTTTATEAGSSSRSRLIAPSGAGKVILLQNGRACLSERTRLAILRMIYKQGRNNMAGLRERSAGPGVAGIVAGIPVGLPRSVGLPFPKRILNPIHSLCNIAQWIPTTK